RQTVDELAPIVSAKLVELAATIEQAREGSVDAAIERVRTDRGKVMMDKIRELVGQLSSTEQRLLAERDAAWEGAVRWGSYVTFGGVGVIACMILLVGWFASRDYRLVAAEDWMRRVQMGVTATMQGDFAAESLATKVLRAVVEQLDATVGAVHLVEPG